MGTYCLQMGHVARTRGATGTGGEQQHARRVCEEAARRLRGIRHTVHVVGADQNIPRTDGFVAVHFDGSTSTSARGASFGHRGDRASIDAGLLWQATYTAAGQRQWRPQNYTAALAGYYGTGRARANGTPKAIIIEGEFLTNPQGRAWVESAAGLSALAQSLVAALTGRAATPVAPVLEVMLDAERVANRTRDVLLGADAHGQGVRERLHDMDVQSAQARDNSEAMLAILRARRR